MDIRKLKRNAVIVAEALVRYMYNLSDKVRGKLCGDFFFLHLKCCQRVAEVLMLLTSFAFSLFYGAGFSKRIASLQGKFGMTY